MDGLSPATETLALPIWVAFMLAALVAGLCVVATVRAGTRRTVMAIVQYSFFALALLLAWTWFERVTWRDRADERRALEARMSELTTRALAPGSPLACLDASAGESIENACERAIFATPESAAAAVAYTAARLQLLSDATDFANRGDGSYELAVVGLRRSIEIDRFGLTAQVLSTRDNCTDEKCDALSLFRNPARVIANLREKTFESYVGRNVGEWMARNPGVPGVAAAPFTPRAGASRATINYPSAASIPPVSIMNNEPGMTGQSGVEPEARPAARRASAPARPANAAAEPASAAPATSATR
ncbi:MAG: hypothetical protein AB7K35_05950 [Pseudorhodoplanes sp.]